MTSKAQKQAGYLLPDPIAPYPLRCVHLKIPDAPEYREAFLGQMWALATWFTWQKSYEQGDRRASAAADYWRDILYASLVIDYENTVDLEDCCMNCCCEPAPFQRINEDGYYQTSEDGINWTTDKVNDPRFSSPTAPPAPPPYINQDKCDGALSVVVWLQGELLKALGETQAWGSISSLIPLVLVLLAIIGVFSGGILIPILLEVAAVMFNAGVQAFADAFTQQVWDELQCILYCFINEDGSFSESGWFNAKEKMQQDLPPLPGLWLTRVFTAIGPVGMTNAARMGLGANADCTACDCGSPCIDPGNIILGTFVSQTANSITIDSALDTVFLRPGMWIRYGNEDHTQFCCFLETYTIDQGVINAGAWEDCIDGSSHDTPPAGNYISILDISNTGALPFRMTLYFAV